MRKLYLLLLLLGCSRLHAQSKTSCWGVGINPLSALESMPSIGPSAAYRFSPRLELWGEASYIFANFYAYEEWKNLNGYRLIVQPRWYTGSKKLFFIAAEFRLKHYTYYKTESLLSSTVPDSSFDFSYKGSQVLVGGALLIGRQFALSANKRLLLEITAGIGSKSRHIKPVPSPAGYRPVDDHGIGFGPQYDVSQNVPYFPLGFRLSWKLR